jgi:meso-butanediol dehydrogenase / (S,S)-butanediol dehydrogenase / diacetyl reductase
MVTAVLVISGWIDCLVNNAGVTDFCSIEDTSFERWRTVMTTNLDGGYLCSRAVLTALKQSRGSIVNIASISGLRASTLLVAYGTSKAGVVHLTQQFAAEMSEFSIRVNCVAPGPARTKLAIAVHSQAIIDAYHDAIPLNR